METAFAALSGLFFASAVYLMLSRHLIRVMLGVALLGNAVNLLLFTAGRITRETPPVIAAGKVLPASAANPLPQALILTAIVISFSFFAFLMVLTYRAWQALGTDDVAEMRAAEPLGQTPPPVEY